MHEPRLLRADDVTAAMELKQAAGWNQTEQDWLNVVRLSPEGVFAIDGEGRLAATATAVAYGQRLGWIGMVLTHPQERRRGFARRLMQEAVTFLDARGVEWQGLDATDMGRPLYEQLGFTACGAIERWRREPAPFKSGEDLPAAVIGDVLALDRPAFDADRGALLVLLAAGESAQIAGAGYVMGRPGSMAAYLGPLVARDAATARRLARWWMARHAGAPACWDLLPDNTAAVELARELGFAPVRRLTRMLRPGASVARPWPATHDAAHVFAIAGFEFG